MGLGGIKERRRTVKLERKKTDIKRRSGQGTRGLNRRGEENDGKEKIATDVGREKEEGRKKKHEERRTKTKR